MNNKYFIIGFLIILGVISSCSSDNLDPEQIACTMDAKMCPDGSYVGRGGPNCEFLACPELVPCDLNNPCPETFECMQFENLENPICFSENEDPCLRCPSFSCEIAESYPVQIFCKE